MNRRARFLFKVGERAATPKGSLQPSHLDTINDLVKLNKKVKKAEIKFSFY